MNQNLVALARGEKFRLEIAATNLARSAPEFAATKAAANRRRRELRESGYRVTLFAITPDGGLDACR